MEQQLGYKQACFTKEQLEIIINSYLGMDPYATILLSVLPSSQPYSYSTIESGMNSRRFYQLIPLYVGSLLTSTNIQIILKALRMVGKDGTINIPKNIKILRKFQLLISLFTLYQKENHITYVHDDLKIINSIIKNAGVMITPKVYTQFKPKSELQNGRLFIYEMMEMCANAKTIEEVRRDLVSQIQDKDKRMKTLLYQKMSVHELLLELSKRQKEIIIPKRRMQSYKSKQNKNNTKKEDKKNIKIAQDNQYKAMINKLFVKKQSLKDVKTLNYNKNLLNGVNIKNEIKEQIANGISIISDTISVSKFNNSIIQNVYNNCNRRDRTFRRPLRIDTLKTNNSLKKNNIVSNQQRFHCYKKQFYQINLQQGLIIVPNLKRMLYNNQMILNINVIIQLFKSQQNRNNKFLTKQLMQMYLYIYVMYLYIYNCMHVQERGIPSNKFEFLDYRPQDGQNCEPIKMLNPEFFKIIKSINNRFCSGNPAQNLSLSHLQKQNNSINQISSKISFLNNQMKMYSKHSTINLINQQDWKGSNRLNSRP